MSSYFLQEKMRPLSISPLLIRFTIEAEQYDKTKAVDS